MNDDSTIEVFKPGNFVAVFLNTKNKDSAQIAPKARVLAVKDKTVTLLMRAFEAIQIQSAQHHGEKFTLAKVEK